MLEKLLPLSKHLEFHLSPRTPLRHLLFLFLYLHLVLWSKRNQEDIDRTIEELVLVSAMVDPLGVEASAWQVKNRRK
jgi:hypothetical protein